MEKIVFEELMDSELIELAGNGDSKAIDFVMAKYANLVRSKARPYFLIGGDKEDLIQEGMIGLFKAIRDYDLSKEASFKVFAEMCIMRQIISAIKAAGRQKHIPLNSSISLNKPVVTFDEENEKTLYDILIDTRINPEELFIAQDRFSRIENHIYKILTQLEKDVLDLYLEGKTYHEIGESLGCTKKAIDNALQRVKKKVEKYVNIEEKESN